MVPVENGRILAERIPGARLEILDESGLSIVSAQDMADGAQKIILKAGVANKSKALVKGKGANLPDPLDSGALGLPVTAQLLNYQSGVCWQGTFGAPSKNSSVMFKAKNP